MNGVLFLSLLSGVKADVGVGCESDCAVVELPEIVDVMGEEVTSEAEGAEGEDVSSSDDESTPLPAGDLDAEALLKIVEQWSEEGPSVLEIFGRLADGETRTIPGSAVREAAEAAGVSLADSVAANALKEVVIGEDEIRVLFDDDLKIPVASKETLVLDPQDEENPFSVDGQSVLMVHESDSYTLKINEELVFSYGASGITGIRAGDLVGKKFIFSRDIALRTVHGESAYERLDGLVVLEVDEEGEPIIVDGQYVPKEADEWLEITVGDEVSRVGISRPGP